MNRLNLRSALPWLDLNRARSLHLISRADWPVLAGLCAGIFGLVMLGASWYLQRQANYLPAAAAAVVSSHVSGQQASIQSNRTSETAFPAPEQGTHLDDLGRLFKLAKNQGVNLGTIEYRYEANTVLPIVVRTMELRINEDYPKLKSFVAELLSTMPHASLQEIRVERKDASALQGQILLKLSFVYQTPGKNSSVTLGEPDSRRSVAATADRAAFP